MSKKALDEDIRNIVLDMLVETLEDGAFSHLVLNHTLEDHPLSLQDKAFLERLFHGVLEQVIYLDWIISSYSSVKLKKIKPVIRNILRMSLYQILFMDSVPDHAAVNEAAKLAKKRGYAGLVPFVNGVLRAFLRGGVKPGMPQNVKHAVPLWLYDRLVNELGQKKAEAFFDAVREPRNEIFARLSLNGTSAEAVIKMLEEDGCEVSRITDVPEAVKLKLACNLTDLAAWKQGHIVIQDLSSIMVGRTAAEFADPSATKQILDVCAAPGGKSLHLASLFPEAEVLARDLSRNKVRLIEENIRRCGLGNIRAEAHDALIFDDALREKMDLVLADLPCSGIGVIGRKPDIKLRLKEEDLQSLSELQRDILAVVSGYVREGGLLLYSTCTVNRSENQENTEWFLRNHPFELLTERQYLPGREEGDGFYLACMRKKQ